MTIAPETLKSTEKNKDFFFLNNGVTIVTSKITYNNLQEKDVRLDMKEMHIINGGQTCKTIHQVLANNPDLDVSKCFVLVRVYELDGTTDDIIDRITLATNSQSVVDLSDLKSNDEYQRTLAKSIPLLGEKDGKPLFSYVAKKGSKPTASVHTNITINVAAEAVLSVWRRRPNNARFNKNKLFGPLYETIFDGLNAAQLVVAVLIWRHVENMRKHNSEKYLNDYRFIPYASNIIAMQIGKALLKDMNLNLEALKPADFLETTICLDENKDMYYVQALSETKRGMEKIGIDCENETLQRISATFRRADLIAALE